MFKVTIKETQNPTILKFEFPDFLSYGSNFEYKNIDETENSPLAKKLFYLPLNYSNTLLKSKTIGLYRQRNFSLLATKQSRNMIL